MRDEVKRVTTPGWIILEGPPKSGAYLLPEIRFRIACSFATSYDGHSLLVVRLANTSTSAVQKPRPGRSYLTLVRIAESPTFMQVRGTTATLTPLP